MYFYWCYISYVVGCCRHRTPRHPFQPHGVYVPRLGKRSPHARKQLWNADVSVYMRDFIVIKTFLFMTLISFGKYDFQRYFLEWKYLFSMEIPQERFPQYQIHGKSALIEIMACVLNSWQVIMWLMTNGNLRYIKWAECFPSKPACYKHDIWKKNCLSVLFSIISLQVSGCQDRQVHE